MKCVGVKATVLFWFRYTMAAQDLVMKARGVLRDRGWRIAGDRLGSGDDISVFIIPLMHSNDEASWPWLCALSPLSVAGIRIWVLTFAQWLQEVPRLFEVLRGQMCALHRLFIHWKLIWQLGGTHRVLFFLRDVHLSSQVFILRFSFFVFPRKSKQFLL